MGGKGLFVKELEECLLEKSIDVAVHSLKDVPTFSSNKLNILSISICIYIYASLSKSLCVKAMIKILSIPNSYGIAVT